MTHGPILSESPAQRLFNRREAESFKLKAKWKDIRHNRRLAALNRPPRRLTEPSTFGLSPAELEQHGRQLLKDGWSSGEVRQRLVDPGSVAA